MKFKVFISSVQAEFASERQALFDYLTTDALLGRFFEPFIFEKTEAQSTSAQNVYFEQVERCDMYIGLLGEQYGNEDENGTSPTEKEYDLAANLGKIRLIYIKKTAERSEKEKTFIKKIEQQVVRKSFEDFYGLKTSIYASLVRFLEEEEIIRIFPFDATINKKATLKDIDVEVLKKFIRRAQAKRNFPFDESEYLDVLLHLNLMEEGRLTNAALLLFGKQPQKFVITSCVKCCQFYGNETVRPIPSLHIYEGTLFELVDKTASFVMSRIDATVSGRDTSVLADVTPEIPLQAVTEAVVNAICHRDYTSNGSVQVMLYKNRLEIWNPGQLPYGLTPALLKTKHKSLPLNPLIARPLYLYGSIEQVGTGTEMLVKKCVEQGLRAPDFESNTDFTVTFWRNEDIIDDSAPDTKRANNVKISKLQNVEIPTQVGDHTSTMPAPYQHRTSTVPVKEILRVLESEMNRKDIQKQMQLSNKAYFLQFHLQPAIEQGLVAMKYPERPNHPRQKYYLTVKGLEYKNRQQ
jgi:predicted HTH transcriptional regulator